MKRWIIRIVLAIVVLGVAVVGLGWSVLALPAFSGFRSALVSDVLTDQIGQPLLVNGDVRVVVGPVSRVAASRVQIPSENMTDVHLAKLDNFEFDLDLLALLDGRIDLNNLAVDGLKIELLKSSDGTTSWNEKENQALSAKPKPPEDTNLTPSATEQATDETSGGLLAFLRTRTVAFTNVGLNIDDQVSGFEFEFVLEELSLKQIDGGSTLGVVSKGQVNGQPFAIDGNYPEGAPFETIATFSSVEMSFNGDPIPEADGGGYSGLLNLQVASIQELLDVLKLTGELDGDGSLEAAITNTSGQTSIQDISTALNLAKGQLITLSGGIDNFGSLDGFDLEFNARLHPENEPPENAKDLKDLKLASISTRIVSENKELELDDLVLATNAFEQGLDEVGPVSIGRIRRTEEGTLAFQDVSLQAGPLDQPILRATGDIQNILELKNLNLEGKIDAPASLVLSGLGADVAEDFGGIEAEFAVDDSTGALSLTQLTAKAVNTDVWALDADIKVGDVTTLNGSVVDIAFDIADGASFLEALNLDPVESGALNAGISVLGEDGSWTGELALGAGTSEITGSVTTGEANGRPTITAAVISEALVIDDLRKALAGLTELGKMGSQESPEEGSNDIELQPLVLPVTVDEASDSEAKDTQAKNDGEELETESAESDTILDFEEFLRETDIYGRVDFKKISGIQGVTQVSSDMVSEGGKARLGPLEFNYGGGYFNFEAAMDVIEAPDYVSVSGATSGWNLADILKAAGVTFDASGALSGRFNVGGRITSVDTFINSMTGSATVRMAQGKVATSLLELAGLGIFPWLFSEEIRQGYTDVVCVNVPVNFNDGAVTFDSVVAETQSVQLVAKGSVDWKRDVISLRAEPRPVGKPLARSAWPFDVSGKLSDPKFKLDIGGSRSRRVDGADVMPANREPCRPDINQLQ